MNDGYEDLPLEQFKAIVGIKISFDEADETKLVMDCIVRSNPDNVPDEKLFEEAARLVLLVINEAAIMESLDGAG